MFLNTLSVKKHEHDFWCVVVINNTSENKLKIKVVKKTTTTWKPPAMVLRLNKLLKDTDGLFRKLTQRCTEILFL